MPLLLIDNYDSFVHNLARYFELLGQETVVVRNDAVDTAAVRSMRPGAIVLSPGPCAPAQAGVSLELVRELHTEIPILGVCLGHQTIAEALGGQIIRAPEPVHGRSSLVRHDSQRIFAGLPNPLRVGRYHSLVADEKTLPVDLQVTARTADCVVMALQHRRYPVVGVQFHPESILTEGGFSLLANFLRQAGLTVPAELPNVEVPDNDTAVDTLPWPTTPITF